MLGTSSQNRICAVAFLVTSLFILTVPILTFLGLLDYHFFVPHCSVPTASVYRSLLQSCTVGFQMLLLDCFSENWPPSQLLAAALLLKHPSLLLFPVSRQPQSFYFVLIVLKCQTLSREKSGLPGLIFWCQSQIINTYILFFYTDFLNFSITVHIEY